MKLLFLGGVSLLFISLFLDWYSYQVYDVNNVLIASWDYNIFLEWSTKLALKGEDYKPVNLKIPLIISALLVGLLIMSIYITIFRDLEESLKLNELRKFAFILLFLLILVLFYIIVFPVMYLFPNRLYFPNLLNYDSFLELSFSYSISIGYILQLVGFILIFPYSAYYYLTINKFEKKEQSFDVQTEQIIQSIQEKLDLDKLLAEEVNES
jgi:hypothetical protein